MNNVGKNLALWVIIALLLVVLFNLFQGPSIRGPVSNLAFSEFLAETDAGQISDVTIKGNSIAGHYADGRAFTTYAPNDPTLVTRLSEKGVRISAAPTEDGVPS
ncbi:MAG: ATP-dependent metallopeptidase FtsH/Yme1/Tma family protein, partial [Proteobacteria bacterium]|nr:ATP-dependent metallopeptidase FtsH/Yme1/Tma family protein [Pseudomonadota bacterium]